MGGTLRAPTLYHVGRVKNRNNSLFLEKEIMIWCNHNLSFNEIKYLYALMQNAGDGTFSPSGEFIFSVTGLNKQAQSKARINLKDKGIIEHKEKSYIKVRYDKLYELAKEIE